MLKQQCIKEFVKFESQGRFHKESDTLAGLTNRNDGSYGFYHIASFTDLSWLDVSSGVGCDFVSSDQCQVPGVKDSILRLYLSFTSTFTYHLRNHHSNSV